MADEVRVMVARWAFGLGINKAAVARGDSSLASKSVEQYYRGGGPRGRDALPPLLLCFGKKKIPACTPFLFGKIEDPAKKNVLGSAPRVERFVQSKECRPAPRLPPLPAKLQVGALWQLRCCAATPDWLEIAVQSPRRKRDAVRKPQTTYSSRARPATAASHRANAIDLSRLRVERVHPRVAANYRKRERSRGLRRPPHPLSGSVCGEPTSLLELRRVSASATSASKCTQRILDALRRFRGGERASNEGKQSSSPAKNPAPASKKVAPSKRLPQFAHAPARRCLPRRRHDRKRRRRISARLASPRTLQPSPPPVTSWEWTA